MSTEAEECPLLEVVTTQGPVTTEDFVCAAVTVICRVYTSVEVVL
jgi:hypothetical protein